jgi:hypothetical protein
MSKPRPSLLESVGLGCISIMKVDKWTELPVYYFFVSLSDISLYFPDKNEIIIAQCQWVSTEEL